MTVTRIQDSLTFLGRVAAAWLGIPTSFLALHFRSVAAKVWFYFNRARSESSCFHKSGSRGHGRYQVKLKCQVTH